MQDLQHVPRIVRVGAIWLVTDRHGLAQVRITQRMSDVGERPLPCGLLVDHATYGLKNFRISLSRLADGSMIKSLGGKALKIFWVYCLIRSLRKHIVSLK